MRIYYSDHYEIELPVGHRFPMGKYAALRTALLGGVVDPRSFIEAPLATVDELMLAHDPTYVKSFLDGTLGANAMRSIGFPWTPSLVARTRAAVGGTLAATKYALKHGFAGNLAGGTHHAYRDRGSGFCVFNDLAIAARFALQANANARVLIFDADVHQGDGTATIFADEPRVFTCSIHGMKNFPFRKATSSIDIELQDAADDDTYFEAIVAGWTRSMACFTPTLILYQAGVDALAEDKLGRLAVTHAGFVRRDQLVFKSATSLGIPLVLTLGGGYAHPIAASVQAHVGTYRVAKQFFGTPTAAS
jgi:acetoin utilization deacetylase AcuC-like enzyme